MIFLCDEVTFFFILDDLFCSYPAAWLHHASAPPVRPPRSFWASVPLPPVPSWCAGRSAHGSAAPSQPAEWPRTRPVSAGLARYSHPPVGAKCLDLWCAKNPTAPWRSWHGRFSPSVFSIYQIIALYAGKSNILFKSCYNFRPHIDAGWYSESKATYKP